MATLRELKGRIGSVSSSEKITGAMKMISSAKMHKAELMLRRLLPFKRQIQNTIGHLLSTDGEYVSPLTTERQINTMAIVAFGSDDGLCGAFNINIFKELLVMIRDIRSANELPIKFVIYPVGSKMTKAVAKIADDTIEVKPLDYITSKSTPEQITQFTEELKTLFTNGTVDAVKLLYMSYKSAGKQFVYSEQLLPITETTLSENSAKVSNKPYLFEPDANAIFNVILPLFVLSTVQKASAESRASEYAARVMAMQSANDNATKLLEELQLEYNKLRQQSITTELLDILGGQIK